jgi:hypothetical protein
VLQFLPANQLTGPRCELSQNFTRLKLKADGFPILAKFGVCEIQLKNAKAYPAVVAQDARLYRWQQLVGHYIAVQEMAADSLPVSSFYLLTTAS